MYKKILVILSVIVFSVTFYIGYQFGVCIWEGYEPKQTLDTGGY